MPDAISHIETAETLMKEFADRTGVSSDKTPVRYLWTDAFAVCNFFSLADITGNDDYHKLAIGLIDQVHGVLGKHRDDDSRSGWISGLDEVEGRKHPTKGGLRIGKPLPERNPEDPFDQRKEWELDGQYFHYLTKWMLDNVFQKSDKFLNLEDAQKELDQLKKYLSLGESIESFWLEPSHRESDSWKEHEDINAVMLATSLQPAGFLEISFIN